MDVSSALRNNKLYRQYLNHMAILMVQRNDSFNDKKDIFMVYDSFKMTLRTYLFIYEYLLMQIR